MKKLLFALLIISQNCFSEYYTVLKSSVSDSSICQYGSLQWADIIMMASVTAGDSINIYIQHDSADASNFPKKIFAEQRYTFLNRPFNSDSISRRIYFNLPTVFHSGRFKISTLHIESAYSYFPQDTTIIDTIPIDTIPVDTIPIDTLHTDIFELNGYAKNIERIKYYSLSGQEINSLDNGICIRETILINKAIERKIIYLIR